MSCSFLCHNPTNISSPANYKFSLFIKSHRTCYLHHILLQLFPHIVLFSVHKLVSPKGCRFLEKGDFIFYLSSMLNFTKSEDYNLLSTELNPLCFKCHLPFWQKLVTRWDTLALLQIFPNGAVSSKASICSSNWSFELSES